MEERRRQPAALQQQNAMIGKSQAPRRTCAQKQT